MGQGFVSPSPSVLLVVLKGCYRPFSHFPPVILLNIYLVSFISKFCLKPSRPSGLLLVCKWGPLKAGSKTFQDFFYYSFHAIWQDFCQEAAFLSVWLAAVFDIFHMRDPSSWILGQFSPQQLTLSLTLGSVTSMVFRSG